MQIVNYYPSSIYYYKQSEKVSRMNYIRHDGKTVPELVYELVRGNEKGQLCIRIGKPKNKKGSKEERTELALFNTRLWTIHPELRKLNPDTGEFSKPDSVSNIYEPDINRVGQGYGNIRGTESAFLSFRNIEAGTLKIMVFPNLKLQQNVLFTAWGAGCVSEAISDNKVDLTPLFDTEGGNND